MHRLKNILKQPAPAAAICYATVWALCLFDWMWAQKLSWSFSVGNLFISPVYWLVFLASLPATWLLIRWGRVGFAHEGSPLPPGKGPAVSDSGALRKKLRMAAVLTICYVFWWQLSVFLTDALVLDSLRAQLARIGTAGLFFIGLAWVVWWIDEVSYRYERSRPAADRPDIGRDLGRMLLLTLLFVPALFVWARRRSRPIRIAAIPAILVGCWLWLTFLISPGYLVGSSYFAAEEFNDDYRWLPADVELVASVRPAALWNSPFAQRAAEAEGFEEQMSALAESLGFDPRGNVAGIDRILVGANGVSGLQPTSAVVVLHALKPFDPALLAASYEPLSAGKAAWHRLRKEAAGLKFPAIYLPEPQTLIAGDEPSILAILQRSPTSRPPRRAAFYSLDLGRQLSVGLDPTNGALLGRARRIPYLRDADVFDALVDALQNGTKAVSLGVSLMDGATVVLEAECAGVRTADFVEARLARLVEQTGRLLAKTRDELENPEKPKEAAGAESKSPGNAGPSGNAGPPAGDAPAADAPANFPGEDKPPAPKAEPGKKAAVAEADALLSDEKRLPGQGAPAQAIDWSKQFEPAAAETQEQKQARIARLKELEQILQTVAVQRSARLVTVRFTLPPAVAADLPTLLSNVFGEDPLTRLVAWANEQNAPQTPPVAADANEGKDQVDKPAAVIVQEQAKEASPQGPSSTTPVVVESLADNAAASGLAILREMGEMYARSLADFVLPRLWLLFFVAALLAGAVWPLWQAERRARQRRSAARASAADADYHRPWWVDAPEDDHYIWNPLDADAWYYGQRAKKLNQSLTALISYSFSFLLAFLLFTQVGGCEEIFEMPAGGGEQKQLAQQVKVQKIIKKKFVVNPFSAIKFLVPPIDEVKLQLTEITEHAYTVGYGQGSGAGFAGGTNRGKVRFIRLEYQGGDWNQDFGVGADLNMLIEYGIRTKQKVAEQTESRTIGQLGNFAMGKSPPLVYMTGRGNIVVSKPEVEILRDYLLEKHGMIFGDVGGANGFDRQFIAMMQRVLPEVRPVPVPLDDVIHRIPYQIPFLPIVVRHGGREALGWKVDGRWVCYLHPGDIGDAWTDDHAGVPPEIYEACYQLGTNVINYAYTEYSKWLVSRMQNK